MAKSTTQNVVQTTSNIGAAQLPYYNTAMQGAQSLLTAPTARYDRDRLEGFTQEQQRLQQEVAGMQTPGQFGTATNLATAAGIGSLQAGQYNTGQFNAQQIGMPNLQNYTMQGPANVQAQQYGTPQMGGARDVFSNNVYAQNMQGAQTGYRPELEAFGFGPTRDVTAERVNAPMMQAAQSAYGQGPLEQFRMEGPQAFGGVQAEQYMSPFQQNVTDVQKREAIRDAQKGQLAQDLGAARQGTFGGSRQLLAGLERERNLGTQLGDIQARGSQAAFENAQQQFERDRAAGITTGQQNLSAALQQQQLGVNTGLQVALANLSNEQQSRVNNQATQFQANGMNADNALRAALANQGVDVTRAQANLQSQLGTQELGATMGMQTALANLSNEQQARVNNQAQQFQAQGMNVDNAMRAALANQGVDVTRGTQNLAAQLQTQGLNSEQAMRAALANQQTGFQVGQQNLSSMLDTQRLGAQTGLAALQSNQQADLDRQRMLEQSRQFGSSQGLAGLAQAGQMGQTLSNIGSAQQQADAQRIGLQTSTAAQQQAFRQQQRDLDYQDFLREADDPYTRLQRYMSLMSGVPQATQTTQTSSAPSPSIGSQLLAGGLGAASIYNTANRAGVI